MTMPNPQGPTGEMPGPRPCTAMQPTGFRRRGLISPSDGSHTPKCPYMDTCNPGQTHRLRGGLAQIGGHNGCTVQRAPSCTPEVVA
jgi:hypothetical protein